MSTVMVRAEMTPEQWRDLRKVAIDRDVPVQELVGNVLINYLLQNGYEYVGTTEVKS